MTRQILALAALCFAPLVATAGNYDRDAEAALALAAASVKKPEVPTPVAPLPPSPVIVTEARGHTHTCANGHTWDHSMDGGSHRCPTCGLSQFIVDQPTRTPTAFRGSSNGVTYYTLGSSSGCANGNCPTVTTTTSRGPFGWRR